LKELGIYPDSLTQPMTNSYNIFESVEYQTYKHKGNIRADSKEKAIENAKEKGMIELTDNANEYMIIQSDKIESVTGDNFEKYFTPTF